MDDQELGMSVACSVCTAPITDPKPGQTQHELCRLAQMPWQPQPRQIPGMARLMELTPELYAHYADPEETP